MFLTADEKLLKDSYFWSKGDFIFLKAPPGMGKSKFIRTTVFQYAIVRNEKVLYLTNRTLLFEQIKNDTCNEIRNQAHMNICITTYQKIEKMKTKEIKQFLKEFQYVVCDEAHYFLSDSLFNTQTCRSFQPIIEASINNVTIFMSATLDRIRYYVKNVHNTIIAQTMNASCCPSVVRFWDYDYDANYKNYNVFYCESWEEYLDYIQENKRKALVFVASISDGNDIMKSCSKRGISAVFLNSEAKTYAEGYEYSVINNIVEKKCYDEQVLIATAILDTGVSIWDDELHDVAIFNYNYEQFIQMLGRKRCKEDEKINLTLLYRDGRYFNSILNKKIVPALNLYAKYFYMAPIKRMQSIYGDISEHESAKMFTYWDYESYGFVQLNPLSYVELENERNQMVYYLQLIKEAGPLEVLRYQMEMWLKLPGAMLQKLPNSKTQELRNQLCDEFDSIANIPMDIQAFHMAIGRIRGKMEQLGAFSKNLRSNDNISKNELNNYFKNTQLPFGVSDYAYDGRKRYYIITRQMVSVSNI